MAHIVTFYHDKFEMLPLQLSWQRICLQCRRPGFDPWVGKIPWKRERVPTPVFWPGEFHGLDSPWGCKELDTTERLSLSLLKQNLNWLISFSFLNVRRAFPQDYQTMVERPNICLTENTYPQRCLFLIFRQTRQKKYQKQKFLIEPTGVFSQNLTEEVTQVYSMSS